ncbi:GNAT family N-acetyltransferase [Paenibacillus apiarius]|uniref:GNAT family N-acetyltransferase n=1 Tax=Paenibacillus apiarius TaxID=46240 RepID=UPI00197F59F0|nr:GNAT family N-acetyltransferase [Paenibacillus apiarius]MBN3523178.1 GNAT family N-acetyltransferase [Paenibacillus apiarius]
MIRLRRPKSDDESIWLIIKSELLPRSHLAWDPEQVRKELPRRLKGITYVATNRLHRTVGFVHLLVQEQTLVIDMLAVSRQAQGQGYGRQLLNRAEQYGRKHRCRSSRMLVDYGNREAERFYERNGYRLIRYVAAVVCNEMEKTFFSYKKA